MWLPPSFDPPLPEPLPDPDPLLPEPEPLLPDPEPLLPEPDPLLPDPDEPLPPGVEPLPEPDPDPDDPEPELLPEPPGVEPEPLPEPLEPLPDPEFAPPLSSPGSGVLVASGVREPSFPWSSGEAVVVGSAEGNGVAPVGGVGVAVDGVDVFPPEFGVFVFGAAAPPGA